MFRIWSSLWYLAIAYNSTRRLLQLCNDLLAVLPRTCPVGSGCPMNITGGTQRSRVSHLPHHSKAAWPGSFINGTTLSVECIKHILFECCKILQDRTGCCEVHYRILRIIRHSGIKWSQSGLLRMAGSASYSPQNTLIDYVRWVVHALTLPIRVELLCPVYDGASVAPHVSWKNRTVEQQQCCLQSSLIIAVPSLVAVCARSFVERALWASFACEVITDIQPHLRPPRCCMQ